MDADRLLEVRAWSVLTAGFPGDAVAHQREELEEARQLITAEAVARLEVADDRRPVEALRLRCLLDGLVAAGGGAQMVPEELTGVLAVHLLDLAPPGLDDVA